jgi:hypothetical protein
MEEHLDDPVVVGLYFAYQVVVHLEVVSGRANHQLLEDVQEVDLYFIGSRVEDRLILVALGLLVQLQEVVRADLQVLAANWHFVFSKLMPHLLTKLQALRHRQCWMKYLDLFAGPSTNSSKC